MSDGFGEIANRIGEGTDNAADALNAGAAKLGVTVAKIGTRARELGGTAQQRYGEAAEAVRDITTEAPLTAIFTTMLAAASLGVIAGLLLRRR